MKDAITKHRGEKFVSDMGQSAPSNVAAMKDAPTKQRREESVGDMEQITLKNLSAGRREPSTKRKELNQANLFLTTRQKSKECWPKKGYDRVLNAAQLRMNLSDHHLSKIFKMR